MRVIHAAVAVVGLAAATWVTGAASAGKPGGGGGSTGGGTIWFTTAGNLSLWTMNSDGTGKAQSPAGANPEFSVHGGHRWYLSWNAVGTETYPNGNRRIEAYAVRDDGVSVQLTNQPDLQHYGNGWRTPTEWVPDGQRLAWVARRFVNGVASEGGLYVATLAFDGAGNITGLVSQPGAPAFARPVSGGWPDMQSVSWAPDATQFAYSGSGSVYVADLAGGNLLVASGDSPLWSPNGTKILFDEPYSGNWYTVSPTGGGSARVLRHSSSTYVAYCAWSPAGDFIVYTEASNYGGVAAVWRMPATGGTAVKLTPEYVEAYSTAWTQ